MSPENQTSKPDEFVTSAAERTALPRFVLDQRASADAKRNAEEARRLEQEGAAARLDAANAARGTFAERMRPPVPAEVVEPVEPTPDSSNFGTLFEGGLVTGEEPNTAAANYGVRTVDRRSAVTQDIGLSMLSVEAQVAAEKTTPVEVGQLTPTDPNMSSKNAKHPDQVVYEKDKAARDKRDAEEWSNFVDSATE